ncbi:type II toxin-antitoxin system RelB/DinJ family antitoxin [Rahnella selenatireducens]|uniref:type II toxin-antitoxin system RelB/DinJ family antitoxin n=1 Tax=Rahnella selenatireducens TaxID=3389797 RepID=UPI0039690BED
MSRMQTRVEENLKQEATQVLKKLGIDPSDAMRQLFQYVVDNEKLPFSAVTVVVADSDNGDDIIKIAKERMAHPVARIRVNIDEV